MVRIIKQGISFILVSGLGWVIDLSVYILFITLFGTEVFYSNIISAIPAITFVFFTSTKKIFQNRTSRLKSKYKFIIYLVYQLLLLLLISSLGQYLYDTLMNNVSLFSSVIVNQGKVLIKIAITPISMGLNFLFMKVLLERI